MQVESPLSFTVDRNKEVTRPLHWSGVMHSHLSSDQPHHNVINNNNSGLATVYTMGFSEAQLSAHPSLVMFCKENKFQMALVSWRSQTDSEQRHGAAVHLSSCVATCPAACHVPPHVATLDICTCPQLGSRSRTLCITLLRWSPLQLQISRC